MSIETSRKVPVIVDFWAPWCGPCKQLGPLLEKLVSQANGKVRLVKINVDENQQLAAQMRIQSIPAVFAFVDGQPVDGFMGALPESQIKQFIDRLGSQGSMAEEIEAAVAAGREALAQNNFAEAAQIFAQVLRRRSRECRAPLPASPDARSPRAISTRRKATLALVPPAKANDPEVVSAKAALELALRPRRSRARSPSSPARVEANPDDHQARFDLAVALNAAGKREEALDHLLAHRAPQARLERGSGAQATGQILRGLGPQGRIHAPGPPQIVLHSVLLMYHGFSRTATARPPICRAQLKVFPLPGALLLPRADLPLNIFEPRYLAMVDDALCRRPPHRHDPARRRRCRSRRQLRPLKPHRLRRPHHRPMPRRRTIAS